MILASAPTFIQIRHLLPDGFALSFFIWRNKNRRSIRCSAANQNAHLKRRLCLLFLQNQIRVQLSKHFGALGVRHHPLMVRIAIQSLWIVSVKLSAKAFMQQARNLWSYLTERNAGVIVEHHVLRSAPFICSSVNRNTTISVNRASNIFKTNHALNYNTANELVEEQVDKVQPIPDDLMIREFPEVTA